MRHRRPDLRLLALAITLVAGAAGALASAHASSNRQRVADDHQSPFSSVGRLDIQSGKDVSTCTATLVGDNRTLITASHCAPPDATRLTFHLGNNGPGIEATVYARGDTPNPGNDDDFDNAIPSSGEVRDPSPYWDDWLVLNLAHPVAGPPLETAADGLIGRLQQGANARTPFHIAGFPLDMDSGHAMVWVEGPGIPTFPARSWRGAYSVPTAVRTHEGMSGAAVLVEAEGGYAVAGVVSAGEGNETQIVVGGAGFRSVERKRLEDCRNPAPGLIFGRPCPGRARSR